MQKDDQKSMDHLSGSQIVRMLEKHFYQRAYMEPEQLKRLPEQCVVPFLAERSIRKLQFKYISLYPLAKKHNCMGAVTEEDMMALVGFSHEALAEILKDAGSRKEVVCDLLDLAKGLLYLASSMHWPGILHETEVILDALSDLVEADLSSGRKEFYPLGFVKLVEVELDVELVNLSRLDSLALR
jgi:hypothetical protein